jgi:hypothetical protein
MSAPTEIDTVTEDRQARIETAQVLPHSPANEHPARRYSQSFARLITLPLVDFARFELQVAAPGARDAHPDLGQSLTTVPALR